MKRLISFLLLFIMLFTSGCQESLTSSTESTTMPDAIKVGNESELINNLYDLRKTKITEKDNIKKIADIIPFFVSTSKNVVVSGNTVVIKYNIEKLTKYRSKNELKSELSKVAATIFALVPDCLSIDFSVTDTYNTVYEYPISRNNLKSVYGMKAFDDELIKKATTRRKKLEEYILLVSDISYDKSDVSLKEEEINKKIGDNCEANKEPSKKLSYKYNINEPIPGIDILKYAKENNINLKEYNGKNLDILFYNVKNFKENKETPWMFIFFKEKIIGFRELSNMNEQDSIISALESI